MPLYQSTQLEPSEKTLQDLTLFYKNPCTQGSYALGMDEEDGYPHLLENGTVYTTYNASSERDYLGTDDYCLALIKSGNESATVIAACFPREDTIPIFYPISTLMSVPFLLLTFLVYTVLPELDNLHGSTFRSYVVSLMMSYIMLSSIQLGNRSIVNWETVCTSLGK